MVIQYIYWEFSINKIVSLINKITKKQNNAFKIVDFYDMLGQIKKWNCFTKSYAYYIKIVNPIMYNEEYTIDCKKTLNKFIKILENDNNDFCTVVLGGNMFFDIANSSIISNVYDEYKENLSDEDIEQLKLNEELFKRISNKNLMFCYELHNNEDGIINVTRMWNSLKITHKNLNEVKTFIELKDKTVELVI